MNRAELEHAIRASCDALGVREVIVVGSQAVLGPFPDAPRELRTSAEADVWADELDDLEVAKLNSLGYGSRFHEEFGFHIDPVGPETATLPPDWRERAVVVEVEGHGARGICPEAHDLAVSKLVRGAEKDLAFVGAMLFHRMIQPSVVARRIDELADLDEERVMRIHGALRSAQQRARDRRSRRRRGLAP